MKSLMKSFRSQSVVKVFWIHAKELDASVSKLREDSLDNFSSDDEPIDVDEGCKFRDKENENMHEDNEVDMVLESSCMHGDDFLLNKNKDNDESSSHRSAIIAKVGGDILEVMDYLHKALWGNLTFDHVVSSSIGNSGDILCVWDPIMFVKDHVSYSDYFLATTGSYGTAFVLWLTGANAFNNFISMARVMDLPLGGDKNSKYFHGILNNKRSQLDIRGILVNGDKIVDPSNVKNEFLKHFMKQFSKSITPGIGKWDVSNINAIMHVLKCFLMASGLKINLHKSKLIGIGISNEEVEITTKIMGCSMFFPPFNYLGVKVGDAMSRLNSWNKFIAKISSRLSKWKLKTLSIGGRHTLLKSFLTSIPLYHLSIFKVHVGTLNFMDSSKLFQRNRKVGWKNGLDRFIKVVHDVRGAIDKCNSTNRSSPWLDIIRDDALKVQYPRLYALELCKDIKVAKKMGHSSLDLSYRPSPRGRAKDEKYRGLCSCITEVILP
ncbi:hypothetical protein Tco_0698470 [Tanacetum coccineum]